MTTKFSTPAWAQRALAVLGVPALATLVALAIGALVIALTSAGGFDTVVRAYSGLLTGAFNLDRRGFSETLVAAIPYVLLGLGLAVGFKSGLFNIGVEGQFYMGAVAAAWAGVAFSGLPALLHLPLAVGAGALAGAGWAAIPGYLKARTGAHEVITTIMMNYIAFRITEFLILGPMRDPNANIQQTARIAPAAELWQLHTVPQRLQDPLNALGVALLAGGLAWFFARLWLNRPAQTRFTGQNKVWAALGVGVGAGAASWLALPPLTQALWPFTDRFDRLHIGLFGALLAALFIWWLMERTKLGFELRTAGANPNAAHYAGMAMTRNVVLAMAISGALAGAAGTIEVLGVSSCKCLPLFFASGYGFDSIAIALLGQNNPVGIVLSALMFGALRNGADLMELRSGVSKNVISLVQGLILLFVAAPAMVRWLFRLPATSGETTPMTRGWGK